MKRTHCQQHASLSVSISRSLAPAASVALCHSAKKGDSWPAHQHTATQRHSGFPLPSVLPHCKSNKQQGFLRRGEASSLGTLILIQRACQANRLPRAPTHPFPGSSSPRLQAFCPLTHCTNVRHIHKQPPERTITRSGDYPQTGNDANGGHLHISKAS